MGCTEFGEHWDRSTESMLIDSTSEAVASAGISIDDVDGFWLGTMASGQSGMLLSRPLALDYKPVSRLEAFCATGSEAFRNACYAVASGAYDIGMAIGVEKLKDAGVSGLPFASIGSDGTTSEISPPGAFSQLAVAYAKKYAVDPAELKDALTHVAWKNH